MQTNDTQNVKYMKTYKLKLVNHSEDLSEKLNALIEKYTYFYNSLSRKIAEDYKNGIKIKDYVGLCDALLDKTSAYYNDVCECGDLDYYQFVKKNRIVTSKNLTDKLCKMWGFVFTNDDDKLFFNSSQLNVQGFITVYVSNVKSIMSNAEKRTKTFLYKKYGIKLNFKEITENSTLNEIVEQGGLLMLENGKKYIEEKVQDIIDGKEHKNDSNRLTHYKIILDTYKAHREMFTNFYEVNCDNYNSIYISNISFSEKKNNHFVGTSQIPNFELKRKENSLNFILKIKKGIEFELMGHRQIIDKNGNLLVSIDKENISDCIGIKEENGDFYIILTFKNAHSNNKTCNTDKTIGVDLNTKHSQFTTSEKYSTKWEENGFVNIYKYLLSNKELCKQLKKINVGSITYYDIFKEQSKIVTFGFIEQEFLYTRHLAQVNCLVNDRLIKLYECEKIIGDMLSKLCNDIHEQEGESVKYWYVNHVNILRKKLKAYATVKENIAVKQQLHDLEVGFGDSNDENRKLNSYKNTIDGEYEYSKITKISKTIDCCVKEIIRKANNVINNMGYTMIALENLENEEFKKTKLLFCKPITLLKYKGCLGMTQEELLSVSQYSTNQDMYNVEYDTDGKVQNITYSNIGYAKQFYSSFNNYVIHMIKFVASKNEFLQCNNKKELGVSFVPCAYTSQMDSITGKMPCEIKNKKVVILNKDIIRQQQEIHINGLFCDYNAACNIRNIVCDENKNKLFLDLNMEKCKYNQPIFKSKKYGSSKIKTIIQDKNNELYTLNFCDK